MTPKTIIQTTKKYLQRKWDWFIYLQAYKSINRIIENNTGFGYLFKLYIDRWVGEHPISESLKRATETFFNALNNHDT